MRFGCFHCSRVIHSVAQDGALSSDAVTKDIASLKQLAQSVVGSNVSVPRAPVAALALSAPQDKLIMSDTSQSASKQVQCARAPQSKPSIDLSAMPVPASLTNGASLFAGRCPTVSGKYREFFYSALADNDIGHIIDLREAKDVNAHDDYRPAFGETYNFGSLSVSNTGHVLGDEVHRESCDKVNQVQSDSVLETHTLQVSLPGCLAEAGETRKVSVTVSHFTAWPDFGVISSKNLRALANVLDSLLQKGEGVLVHCQGGVGRTGTLITYYQVKAQLSALVGEGKPVTRSLIIDLVADQRGKNCKARRKGCIETVAQLNLVSDTLAEDFRVLS